MSLITPTGGPPLAALVSFLAGEKLVKAAGDAEVAYNLAGTLYLSQSGWLLLSVPNALVRGVFSAMAEPGAELPLKDGQLNAHITVMSPEDLESIGGAAKVTERGKQFRYTLGRLKKVEPDGWKEMSAAWYVTVHSPALQELRRSYGLSSLPHSGEYDYHVTVAVKRRGVLGRNEVRKAAAAES